MAVGVTTARAQRQLPREVQPVLDFPQPGIDDSASYHGYRTRFYRDSRGNVLQIYLRQNEGRVVNLWADAANESIGFTARDESGAPAQLMFGGAVAAVGESGSTRHVDYHITSNTRHLRLGWFLLGTMRVERDFQYWRKHLDAFTAPPFHVAEEDSLVARLSSLPASERRGELGLLGARSLAELQARLEPHVSLLTDVKVTGHGGRPARAPTSGGGTVLVSETSLDGRHHLQLDISAGTSATTHLDRRSVSFDSREGGTIDLLIRVSTDAAPLTPLTRSEIFDPRFLVFADSAKRVDPHVERQLRSVELLSTREKLMAGLPNFATYFGRDQMMSALMMQSVWMPQMMEHVIGSVLRKLAPDGEVSHEEALGGQAIRENAMVYVRLVDSSRAFAARGDTRHADEALGRARAVLANLERVRENYHMIDDEFQLPVLVARYLADPRMSADAKRAFLKGTENGTRRLTLLAKELDVVARWSAAYAAKPDATNLIGFARRDSTHWESESWRDSGAGYANGRFAMDINAIWVPMALDGIGRILESLRTLGLASGGSIAGVQSGPTLSRYLADTASLRAAQRTWAGAVRHFLVRLGSDEVRARIEAKLASLPADERAYWQRQLAAESQPDTLQFLALSLDARGQPIPVMNTDPATALFLVDLFTPNAAPVDVAPFRNFTPFIRSYPIGLEVSGLGPVVANDAYASPEVWAAFTRDQYHSPRVVWGREVNLLMMGFIHQIEALTDRSGSVRDPRFNDFAKAAALGLRLTLNNVKASGLENSELWSYRIEGSQLVPTRYGNASDVQLWSTTSLAVRWGLAQLPKELTIGLGTDTKPAEQKSAP
jgi:hypothetical protein